MSLRDYQIAAIDATRRAASQGSRAIVVVMPTGAGKTRTMGEIVRLSIAKGKRALWLAHRAELVDQAVGALTAIGVQCGTISASAESAPQPFAPCQVATMQTLIARKLRPPADVIVFDEAHHAVAETFAALVKDYPGALLLGPTATPERSDGRGLGEMFTRIVVGVRVRQLIDAGHLVPAEVIAPAAKLKVGQIAQRPVDAYRQHADGRRAICFSPTVALAHEHSEEFRTAGRRSAVVSGETPWAERRAAFQALRDGSLDVLCNVYVATEGFDVPAIDCVILARGFGAAGTYLQCVGRALRTHAGKRDAIVLDLTGTSHVHGHPHDDRIYSLTGRGITKGEDQANQSYCRVCGAPIIPGAACNECGTEPREGTPLSVTGERLVKYAAKRAEPIEARIATLRRWIADGEAKGYKPSWSDVKFKAVYGDWPAPDIKRAARAIEEE